MGLRSFNCFLLLNVMEWIAGTTARHRFKEGGGVVQQRKLGSLQEVCAEVSKLFRATLVARLSGGCSF